MSIWTPSGEHEISQEQPGETDNPNLPPDQLSPEEHEVLTKEFEETRKRIAESPPEQIIATHVIGLRELAFIHLSKETPDLEGARLAINALAGIVNEVGDELGEYTEPIKGILNEIQMAYVKINNEDNLEEPNSLN